MIFPIIDLAAKSGTDSFGTGTFILIVLLFAAVLIASTVITFKLSRKKLSQNSKDHDDTSNGG